MPTSARPPAGGSRQGLTGESDEQSDLKPRRRTDIAPTLLPRHGYGTGNMAKNKKNSTLRFNAYLIRAGIDKPENALRAKYRPSGAEAMARIEGVGSAPNGSVAFFRAKSASRPGWAEALAPMFPGLGEALNTSNRLVIFVPVSGRFFAICFGYGSSTLEWSAIEPNFGLRFAARAMRADAVKEVRSRRIDASARTTQIQVVVNSDLHDLDIQLEGEFVRRLVGQLDAGSVGLEDSSVIVASDSVSFKQDVDLTAVGAVLAAMLETTTSREAQEQFDFIDALEPLRSSSDDVEQLEDAVIAYLLDPDLRLREIPTLGGEPVKLTALEVAPPDSTGTEDLARIVVQRGKQQIELSDFSIEGLRSALLEFRGRSLGRGSLKSVKLLGLDYDGNPSTQLMPLKNWLVFEGQAAARRFILTLGRWFGLRQDFAERIDRDLRSVVDSTSVLGLPPWPSPLTETQYNASVSGSEWVLMDRVPLYSAGDQVEACDLFHIDGYLVHVKRYNGSQTLSHLFSQGFVSTYVLNGDVDYKADFVEAVEARNAKHKSAASRAPEHVVYGFGMKPGKQLPDDLSTFSKVNLKDFLKRIKQAGAQPSIARIDIL